MTKLTEIQEAIMLLDPKEQHVLRIWLDENFEETPEMMAAIDEGLSSLVNEPALSAEEMRRKVREWTTG